MNTEKILDVEIEMERVSKKIKDVKIRFASQGNSTFYGCAETAALKRASMDLSRALTKLRKCK